LAGPQSHGVGGVGLHRQNLHAQHCRKREKRSTTRNSIENASQKRRHGEPKPVQIDELGRSGEMNHLNLIVEGSGKARRNQKKSDGNGTGNTRVMLPQLADIAESAT